MQSSLQIKLFVKIFRKDFQIFLNSFFKYKNRPQRNGAGQNLVYFAKEETFLTKDPPFGTSDAN